MGDTGAKSLFVSVCLGHPLGILGLPEDDSLTLTNAVAGEEKLSEALLRR